MTSIRREVPGLIELPTLDGYDPILDPYFIERCEFMISCQSGPCSLARALGKPNLVVNGVYNHTTLPEFNELFAFKRYVNRDGAELSVEEALRRGAHLFDRTEHFECSGIRLEDTTAEEIHAAVLEMLDGLDRPERADTELAGTRAKRHGTGRRQRSHASPGTQHEQLYRPLASGVPRLGRGLPNASPIRASTTWEVRRVSREGRAALRRRGENSGLAARAIVREQGMPAPVTGHLEYYTRHGINPVRYDLSDLQLHLDRRGSLYRTLGVTPLAVRGARVLEVAPGTGQNSLYLARLAPRQLDARRAEPDRHPGHRDRVRRGVGRTRTAAGHRVALRGLRARRTLRRRRLRKLAGKFGARAPIAGKTRANGRGAGHPARHRRLAGRDAAEPASPGAGHQARRSRIALRRADVGVVSRVRPAPADAGRHDPGRH